MGIQKKSFPVDLESLKGKYPEKFLTKEKIFNNIHRGDRIFIHTACAEPQYLINELIHYVESNPKSFFDAEVIHVWSLGVAPYTQPKFKRNFRYNSFFIGNNTRKAINEGLADYTPIFLSQIPSLFQKGIIPINVALIQTSYPDDRGYMNIGISVDIVKSAINNANLVITQMNANIPRIHGDGFLHINDVDLILPKDEALLEYKEESDDDIAQRIGKFVSKLVQDGDTIQVGYGSIPNAVLSNLTNKKNLGIHTELLGDGIVELIKAGAVNNSRKEINPGKTIATFSMGNRKTYEYLHDNPTIEFKTVDYTNNPQIIAQHDYMTAINSALEIDLTGQATAESLGKIFYSGIGGQADFMRGAVLAKNGKTILTLPATAENGNVSRIVPFLKEGAGVTLNRGDIRYVVTEYGIAYLHGKNIRERAMELITIAHPRFRPGLIEEAKKRNLIYQDQAFVAGKAGEYPEDLETFRTTQTGLEIFFRPVKLSDEPPLKDFLYSLSNQSLHRRFISERKDMPHEYIQTITVVDYSKEVFILALIKGDIKEEIIGLGQYWVDESSHTADVAFLVRDDFHNKGIGKELLGYLTYLAKRRGLLGFTAEVLLENTPMLHLFESAGFDITKQLERGLYELKITF